MTLDALVVIAFMTFISGGLGSLFWSRKNRFEEELSGLRGDVSRFDARMSGVEARMVTRDDLKRLEDRTGALAPSRAWRRRWS